LALNTKKEKDTAIYRRIFFEFDDERNSC